MMHKRPFVDEDSHDITSKQPRLQEHASQFAHTIDADTVSSINASEKPQTGNIWLIFSCKLLEIFYFHLCKLLRVLCIIFALQEKKI